MSDCFGQRSEGRERLTCSGPRFGFEVWSRLELFKNGWAPKSMGKTLRSCMLDVRTGGE